jgi:L-2,4-diaminobutyrate transaminase
MAEVRHTETPYHYRFAAPGQTEAAYAADLAAKLEALILEEGPETVAAFIAEPVMGSCGMILPPEGYFAAVQEVLRRHEVLMIADEVICGFGRTGRMFGCERYGIEPDMVTIAKGLTSAYLPMSASLISEEIWRVIEGGSEDVGVFAHGLTYGAHPVCAAAALANLDIIEGEDLPGHADTVGAHLFGRLRAALDDHPLVGQVRGIGMIGGIELVADKATRKRFDPARKVAARGARIGLEEGLICRAMAAFGDTLAVSPPLVITQAEADEMVDRLVRMIDRLAGELEGEGVWKAA